MCVQEMRVIWGSRKQMKWQFLYACTKEQEKQEQKKTTWRNATLEKGM